MMTLPTVTSQQVNTLLTYAECIVPGGNELKLRLLTIAMCAEARALKVDRGLLCDGVDNIYGNMLNTKKP